MPSSHVYPDIFESTTFSFRIRPPSRRIQRIRQRMQILLNPLPRVKKKIDLNWQMRQRVDGWIRIFSNPMTQQNPLLPNNKPIRRHKVRFCFLYRACSIGRHFIADEPWVLGWIRIPPEACGQANSIWINATCRQGNFLIWKEKVAGSKISGYVWMGPWNEEKYRFLFTRVTGFCDKGNTHCFLFHTRLRQHSFLTRETYIDKI